MRLIGRAIFLAFPLLLALTAPSPSEAAPCPGNPTALGVSRVIEIDTAGGPRLGTYQYKETLDLQPKEVVLTFDDGPNPKTTPLILDALDHHCVKATFFEIGRAVEANPQLTAEILDRGHTVGNHTWSHPSNLRRLGLDKAKEQVEHGFAVLRAASGGRVAPFFRYPGLNDSPALDDYLAKENVAVISCDIGTDDWMRISADKILSRTLKRLDERGKGILLFHDTEPATARAIPTLLDELQKRGYKIVQIVPKGTKVAASSNPAPDAQPAPNSSAPPAPATKP